jgi:hypothetical protein
MFGRLHGAKVDGGASVPHITNTIGNFRSAIWDSDGYFNRDVQRNVLKVPRSRLAGRYQIRVAIRWINPWNPEYGPEPPPPFSKYFEWNYQAFIRVNGERIGHDARFTAAGVPAAKGTHMNFAVDANLENQDEVAIHFYTTIEALNPISTEYWLEIRRLGRTITELV